MVDSENSPRNYKTLKISMGTIIKHPESLRFVPDHLKTKKMYKNAVEKLPFVVRYLPYRYKIQEVSGKVIIENVEMLRFLPDCYRNLKNVY